MNYQVVVENWNKFARAIEALGGELKAIRIEEPANETEIDKLESELGFGLPSSLREVLVSFSKNVEFGWFLPDDYELEGELSGIFCGDRHWSVEWIKQINKEKNDWISEVFPNKNDPYDIIWHNKLAFHEVGNGDYLAIDLTNKHKEPVVYLSHDGGEGHGVEMASNFKEFVFITSRLGCVGGEDWQWLPFINESRSALDPDCENANRFRSLLGVKA